MKSFSFNVLCNSEFELEYALRLALEHMEKKPDFYDRMEVDADINYYIPGDTECSLHRVS